MNSYVKAVLEMWPSLEASGNGYGVTLLLWVSTPLHSLLEARLCEAFRCFGLKLGAPPHLVVVAC